VIFKGSRYQGINVYTVTSANGQTNDVWISSTAMYSCLVFVVNIRIGLDTVTWTWVSALFMFLSLAAWFCFAVVYSAIFAITPNMYWVAERLFGDINFWLLLALVPAICNLPDVARRYYRRMYHPKRLDIVAEHDRCSGPQKNNLRNPRSSRYTDRSDVQEDLEMRRLERASPSQDRGDFV